MSPVDAARELFPWWVTWGPVLFFLPLSVVLAWAAATVTVLVAGRPGPMRDDEHWTDRARRAWPTRIGLIAGVALVPGTLMTGALAFAGDLCPLGLAGLSAACAALTAAVLLVIRARVEGQIRGSATSLARQVVGGAAVVLCYLPHVLLVALTAPLYGPDVDLRFLAVLVGTAALLPFSTTVGLGLARLLRLARPAPEELEQLVRRIAATEGVETARTLIVAWPVANAFAYPGARRLAFTEGALEVLSEDEIAAVTAHEVGHLTETKGVLVGRLATTFLLLPMGMAYPLSSAAGPLVYGAAAVGSLLLFGLTRSLFQRMESRADDVATRHESDAGVYARALERLHESGMIPAVLGTRRASHPDLYDRLLACGVEPGYPRPAPPASRRGGLAALAGVGAILACLVPIRIGLIAEEAMATDRRDLELAMALGGATGRQIDALAVMLTDAGDLAGAEPLAEASTALAEWSATYPALLAEIRAERGRCDEAVMALAEAERRLREDRGAEGDVEDARIVLTTHCPGSVLPPRT